MDRMPTVQRLAQNFLLTFDHSYPFWVINGVIKKNKLDIIFQNPTLIGAIIFLYGSIGGLGAKFRPVRDGWIADKHVSRLPQRIWRVTLSDSLDDIKANREAAKEKVVRHIFRNIKEEDKRKELFKKLKNDSVWVNDRG